MRISRGLMVAGLAVVAVLIAVVAIAVASTASPYKVQFLMASAEGTFAGNKAMIGGREAGTVESVEVRDNKALVTVDLDDDFSPLHAGTDSRITWQAVLNERFLEILPGPDSGPVLPSGSRVDSHYERVELDQVLATLDPKTLKDTNSVVQQVATALKGREQGLNGTLQYGGPAFNALGEVLQGVGSDGPAIRDLVTQLHQVTSTLDARGDKLSNTVNNLGDLTSATASQQKALSDGISQLPSTLSAAKTTLDKVPGAVDQTVPLLNDLQPATAKLPGIAANLSPVLSDLRPAVGQLRPTLGSAQSLLDRTPGLIDSAHDVLPGATDVVTRAEPAVAFLRPYTPELTGWLTNWTGIWAGQDRVGSYARALLTTSASALGDNPGLIPPGQRRDERPAPGSLVGQPWTDANGDSPQ
jgi:phospholipid/cholesterol/gamma-HCH transport system substrate-binding protein